MTDDNGRLLNEKEAAEYLGLKHTTLQSWRYRGRYLKGGYDATTPKYLKMGRVVRYSSRDLEEFAKSFTLRGSSNDE